MSEIIHAKKCPKCKVPLEARYRVVEQFAKNRQYETVWDHPVWSWHQETQCRMIMREVYA